MNYKGINKKNNRAKIICNNTREKCYSNQILIIKIYLVIIFAVTFVLIQDIFKGLQLSFLIKKEQREVHNKGRHIIFRTLLDKARRNMVK
ncbi:hypothetical protein CWI36_0370p0010 [Hamiltosporidium magnivora]|uniref:Uncharacterized protein n=1 Tax=Hamiltosporidium magnivora TaxID=148818 RepID=A0A4Q9LIL4_9MICR|nr:hypothetical protein CWI36_0370p0010 [Hamiltosporidium magnivora]